MAILDHIEGLEVTFEVNGETSEEYDKTDPADRPTETLDDFYPSNTESPLPYVVKYVEAKPTAPFQIRVTREPIFTYIDHSIFFMVDADGRRDDTAYSDYLSDHSSTWSGTCDHLVSRKPEEREVGRHYFRFGDLDVGEVDNLTTATLKKQTEKAKDWGKVVVRVFHGAVPEEYHLDAPTLVETEAGNGRISEKALKGKALHTLTKFDTTRDIFDPSTYTFFPYSDKRGRPFAIFEFRYRTKNGLMEERIIPRPPTSCVRDEVESMSEAELRRLARELLARQRERAITPAVAEGNNRRVKREIDSTDQDHFAVDAPPYKTRRRDDGIPETGLTTASVAEGNKQGIKRETDLVDEDPFAEQDPFADDAPQYKAQRRDDGILEIDLTEID